MPPLPSLLGFAALSLGMAVTPGPNMIYLLSRSLCQGRASGLISLAGVAVAFLIYMVCAAFGITALLIAIPFAYDGLRLAGAAYLAYLAYLTLKPHGRSAFEVHDLPRDPPLKLFSMGLLTSLLNPKIAMLYLSLLPQFIDPANGNILTQSLALGTIQIVFSVAINGLIILSASGIAGFLADRPLWLAAQRWIMGTVLVVLAVRLATLAQR